MSEENQKPELDEYRWTDTTDPDHVICPYCGFKQWIDESYEYNEDVEVEEECESCEGIFIMATSIIHEVNFTAREIREENNLMSEENQKPEIEHDHLFCPFCGNKQRIDQLRKEIQEKIAQSPKRKNKKNNDFRFKFWVISGFIFSIIMAFFTGFFFRI